MRKVYYTQRPPQKSESGSNKKVQRPIGRTGQHLRAHELKIDH